MKTLSLHGPDSGHAPPEDVEFLGQLMAATIYHEIDQAAEMLLQLEPNNRDVDLIKAACGKLAALCEVVADRSRQNLVDSDPAMYFKAPLFYKGPMHFE